MKYQKNILPFLVVGLLWGAGVSLYLYLSGGSQRAFATFGMFWFCSFLNFGFLAKFMKELVDFLSKTQKKSVSRLLLWTSIKLMGIAILLVLLSKTRRDPSSSTFLGLSTYFIVPILGGIWWEQQRSSSKRSSDHA